MTYKAAPGIHMARDLTPGILFYHSDQWVLIVSVDHAAHGLVFIRSSRNGHVTIKSVNYVGPGWSGRCDP